MPVRERELCVIPEFKAPYKKETTTAVADASPEWIWSETNAETMNPFWAVRRLTEKQLQAEVASVTEGIAPRFNCEFVHTEMSLVSIAKIGGKAHNHLRMFQVPFLTNSLPLLKGCLLYTSDAADE